MKTRLNISLAFLLSIFVGDLQAQLTQSGETGEFTSLNVIGKIRVELYKSDSPSFDLEVEGTTPDNVITENKNGEFGIRLKTGTPSEAEIKVRLYYTELEKITVQAQALVVSLDTLRNEKMVFESLVGGKMELSLRISTIEADVKQGGILVFYGSVDKQTVRASTGGTYSAFELESKETYVTASAGGKAKVFVSGVIDANSNTKGYIGYKGDPAKTAIKTSLGGEIVHLKSDE